MVMFAISLAALAMAASVSAAPAATSPTIFSLESWVEDIIANPDTALTADEALAAFHATHQAGSGGGLQKRVTCDQAGWSRANGQEITLCISALAGAGQLGSSCSIPSSKRGAVMCTGSGGSGSVVMAEKIGLASVAVSANCNDVARTVARIMENCYRADNTVVGSEVCITNFRMNILVHGGL